MDISDPASGEFLDHLFPLAYPALVEQVAFGVDRFYEYLDFLMAFLDVQGDLLSGLASEVAEPCFPSLDLVAVNRQDYVTFLDLSIGEVDRAVREYFLYLEAVAFVVEVIDGSESGEAFAA